MLLRQFTKALLLTVRIDQALCRLAQIGDVVTGMSTAFGADQQTVFSTDCAMPVGAQFKSLTAGFLATGVVFDACNVA